MGSVPKGFISPDLVVVGLAAKDREDAVRRLGTLMYEKGYVKEDWADAALAREVGFPTGLPTEDIKVAIPHTEVQHCIKPGIAMATLAHPVQFIEMATHDSVLDVELIFCLSITKPKEQVKWLKRLVTMFQRPGLLRRLKSSPNTEACYRLFHEELSKDEEEVEPEGD